MSEKIYQFNEYVLGYDKGENDRSCLVISKYLSDKVYVMAELYDGSAEIISTILDSLQQENKQLKNIITELEEYIVNEEKINNELQVSRITSESGKETLGIENDIYDDILDKIQELKEKYK